MARMPPAAWTAATVASSIRLTQSQSNGKSESRTRRARCPIAKPGSVPIPLRSGHLGRNVLQWVARSSARVVQRWPLQPTY